MNHAAIEPVIAAPDKAAPTAAQRQRNRLLESLPTADWQHWHPQLESISLPFGHVLYESGVAPTHAYFPTTAIVSLVYLSETGASFEVAAVGNEGMVGIPIFMGGGSTSGRAVVRQAGHAWRLPARTLQQGFRDCPPLTRLLLRYTQTLIAHMSQTAACNRHHSIEQRLCLWLLQTQDRLVGDEMLVTHELIAHAMGVRRESVTQAIKALQQPGLIRSTRGRIEVLDRQGLEQHACECYAVIQREYDRLFPAAPAGLRCA